VVGPSGVTASFTRSQLDQALGCRGYACRGRGTDFSTSVASLSHTSAAISKSCRTRSSDKLSAFARTSAAMFRLSAARLFIDLVTAWQPDLQAACKNCDGRKAIGASCQFSLRPRRASFGYGKRQYSCDSLTQLSEIALALQIKLIKRPAPLRFLERVPLFPHTESQLDLRDCLKWKNLQLPNAFRPSQIQIRAQEVEHQVHCRTWCWPTCARGPWRRSFEKFGQRGI
jgi:hypothetical protein